MSICLRNPVFKTWFWYYGCFTHSLTPPMRVKTKTTTTKKQVEDRFLLLRICAWLSSHAGLITRRNIRTWYNESITKNWNQQKRRTDWPKFTVLRILLFYVFWQRKFPNVFMLYVVIAEAWTLNQSANRHSIIIPIKINIAQLMIIVVSKLIFMLSNFTPPIVIL